jgi:hypothetical protein
MFEISIKRWVNIQVTAEEARRKVDQWLLDEVSLMIGAEPPSLIVGERAVWRVPAWIGFPRHGRVGVVGTVDVDVETGVMYASAEVKAGIERRAAELASHLPAYQPRATPPDFIAKGVTPAPILDVSPDEQATLSIPPSFN